MNEIIKCYLKYMEFINVLVIIICFGCAGMFIWIRKGNKQRILNRKTIVLDTIVLHRIVVMAMMVTMIFAGLSSIAVPYANGDGDMVSTIVGIVMILFGVCVLIYYFFKINNMLKSNPEISMDIVVNKHSELKGPHKHRHRYYYLQFHDYFKTSGKDVKVPYYIYQKANAGDKFYLVSIEENCEPFAFCEAQYKLEDENIF